MNAKLICFLAAAVGMALTVPRYALWNGRQMRMPVSVARRGRNLLRIARVGPISVTPATTVMDAIKKMHAERVGAVLVIEDDVLKGILTERDIMLRVAIRRKDSKKTPVSEVMTTSVTVIGNDRTPDDALRMMVRKHIRHLPVVGASGRVEGMLSLRHLLGQKVERLEGNLDSLAAYISADGIGG